MQKQIEAVREFIAKHNFPEPVPIEHRPFMMYQHSIANIADAAALALSEDVDLQLVLEEAAEFVRAVACGDKALAADAIGDLLYVIIGRAIRFNLPLEDIFDRVHASNMTKRVSDDRCRDKGDTFVPPDFSDLL